MTSTSEFSVLSIAGAVKLLTGAYTSLIESGSPMKSFPSVMLWGAPGVGKSDGVRQIATGIEEKTDKKVKVTDVRLLLFNPVDLRGIPTADAQRETAIWLKPAIFRMDASDDVVNILFLDEISAAPPSVQAAAYQITLDRTVGEHKLPDNCIVIAAGNRVTDRSVAYNMPKALANRLCHMEISCDCEGWLEWAALSDIHECVTGFISYRPQFLLVDDGKKNSDDLAYPTPRSWAMVSNILKNAKGDIDAMFPLIAGCVGNEAAEELRNWNEIYKKLPSARSIFEGEYTGVPTRPEAMYILAANMIEYARKNHTKKDIINATAYANRLKTEFRFILFRAFRKIPAVNAVMEELELG
ncbi:MAG: AAA family ATPase [Clostridia bacterium]|nr:AAA family ATPase [Clostridia bacterium]